MNKKKAAFQKVLSGALSLALMIGVLMACPVWAATDSSSSSSSSSSSTTSGTDPVITAYTVQDASGKELQQIKEGQKCTIVIAIHDGRYSESKKATNPDSNGNIANAKVTSTGSFASPSLGDIKFTTPRYSADSLDYSVVFNDITYLGGSNKLSFDLSYTDLQVSLVNLSQAISQCVGSTATDGGKNSALVVKSASYGASEVQAGSEFDLSAEILATAGTNALDMVQVSLQLPEKITVVSGNNNYYVGKLSAEASKTVSFRLMASAIADPGSYNVTVNVSGVASDGTAVSNSLQVTVPIVQPERFELTNIDMQNPLFVGEEGTLTVTYVNKGKGIIYNLSGKIEGTGLSNEGQNQYVGNVAAGTEGTIDFSLMADAAGTINGKVILTYEDAKGQEKTLEKEYSVEFQENDSSMDPGIIDPSNPGGDMDMPSAGMPWWGWVLIVVAIVVVAVVVVKVLKKRKEKKLLLEDDDEDI